MADSCCPSCKGAFGICRDPKCFHHIEKQIIEDKDNRNLHRFSDPTPYGRTGLERRSRTRGRRR